MALNAIGAVGLFHSLCSFHKPPPPVQVRFRYALSNYPKIKNPYNR